MAFFANLNKKTSILKYLEIDKGIKANINLKTEDKIPERYMTDYFDDARYENQTTIPLDTFDGEENKKFWMNAMKPSKLEKEVVDKIKQKIKIFEFLIAFLAIISILLSQFEYELEYYPKMYKPTCKNPERIKEYKGQPARIVVSILCLLMALLTINNSLLFYKQKKEEKKIITKKFVNSYYFKRMLLEVFIIIIHPIPYVDACFTSRILSETIDYRVGTFLYALMFLKLFTFLRIIATYTKYSNNLSARYCDIYGSEASTTFALKAIQKDHPFLILTFNFCSVSVVLGILLRMFEILDLTNQNKMNYFFYTNGIWNIIVAMTTVGYGDFYPRTHIGRFIVVVSIVIGTLLVSLTIVALNRLSSMESNEYQAFIILNRLSIRKKLEKVFLNNLKVRLQIYLLRKHKKIKALTQDKQYMKYIRELRSITEHKRELKRMLYKDSFANDEHKFLSLSDQIDDKITFINQNLKLIQAYKYKIRAQTNAQKKLTTNIDASLKLFRNCIKPGYYQLFAKNPSFVVNETYSDEAQFLATINFMNKEELKELAMKQVETVLFNTNKEQKRLTSEQDDDINANNEYLMYKNLLMKQVSEHFEKLREKYSNDDNYALNDSIDSTGGHDKDIVIAEYNKIKDLDKKTKQIYTQTSKKTIDLLHSLHKIKYNNTLVSSKNPEMHKLTVNLPDKVDIFQNLIDDEDAKKLERGSLRNSPTRNDLVALLEKRRASMNKRSTLKPLDLNMEQILNLSPVNPNKKLSSQKAEEDFANNFKIKLIDANKDETIEEKSQEMSNPVTPKKEKLVPTQGYNMAKKGTPGKDGKYVSVNLSGEISPIHPLKDGRGRNMNETVYGYGEQDANKINEENISKEEKLKKKLNETLNFLNSKLIYKISLISENSRLSNMNVKSSLMGRLSISRDLEKK